MRERWGGGNAACDTSDCSEPSCRRRETNQRGEYWMNLYSFRLEEPLCELDIFFAGGGMQFLADVVVGADLIGRYDLMWPSLEERSARIWGGG